MNIIGESIFYIPDNKIQLLIVYHKKNTSKQFRCLILLYEYYDIKIENKRDRGI